MTLKSLIRTTPKYISILASVDIHTAKDFLEYFPRTYQDRTQITPLSELFFDDPERWVITTQAQVIHKKPIKRWTRRMREVRLQDADGNQTDAYFAYRTAYLIKEVKKDKRFLVIGKPQLKYGKLSFWYPEMIPSVDPSIRTEELEESQTGRIYPIYSEIMWIKPAWFAKKMFLLKEHIKEHCKEYLPQQFLEIFQLMDVPTTVEQMHFPSSFEDQDFAEHRIMFDRLLRIQLYAQLFRFNYQQTIADMAEWKDIVVSKIAKEKKEVMQKNLFDPSEVVEDILWGLVSEEIVLSENANRDRIKECTSSLPFELTNAQKRVIKEMIEDIHKGKPMLRLLQWDVWSGKTVVAATVAYYIVKELNQQIAFLAPLSILAQQHYQWLAKLLMPLWVRVEFLAWSLTKGQKEKVKDALRQWTIDFVVWTHALIQDDVIFHNLWLAVVDEQHKFWVKQRSFFKKSGSPHIIQMSATPIPRSLALAFFGEFDVSVIDELPAGRKPIVTKIVPEKEFAKLKQRFLAKIASGQKLFVVAPLIEESDKLENVKSATQEREKIVKLMPEIRGQIGLLHGKMKPQEKDDIMQKFKDGEYMILVATTVIEVWVDVPEATMMLITNAERFGLAQLHQLRWRIGRNDMQSYCFLETKNPSERLRAMEKHTDGFKLAELDLQYRWSGEILGTRQSWDTDIPYKYLTDMDFMNKVKQWSHRLLDNYPQLEWLPWLVEKIQKNIWGMMV